MNQGQCKLPKSLPALWLQQRGSHKKAEAAAIVLRAGGVGGGRAAARAKRKSSMMTGGCPKEGALPPDDAHMIDPAYNLNRKKEACLD